MASGYNQQKAEPVQPLIILQGKKGWAESCRMVSSSLALWFLLGSALFPMQDTARIILMDFLLQLTVSAPVPLSAPIMRGSELIYSH